VRSGFALHFLFREQAELEGIENVGGIAVRFLIACVFCCGEDVLDLGFLLVARKPMRFYAPAYIFLKASAVDGRISATRSTSQMGVDSPHRRYAHFNAPSFCSLS